jgi:hypothetical protein
MPRKFASEQDRATPERLDSGTSRALRIAIASLALAAASIIACEMRPDVASTPPAPVTAEPAGEWTAWAPAPPAPAAEPAPQAVLRPPPAPARLPPTLVGFDRDQLAQLFGPPGFKRRDNPVEIWQYRGADCTLDLFLYRDGASDVYRVAHYEVRARGPAKATADECMARLAGDGGRRRSG